MVPKIKDAVLDECISNCKTQPQNIFELTKFGIRKIIGGQKLSLHLKSIRSKNINDTQIVCMHHASWRFDGPLHCAVDTQILHLKVLSDSIIARFTA